MNDKQRPSIDLKKQQNTNLDRASHKRPRSATCLAISCFTFCVSVGVVPQPAETIYSSITFTSAAFRILRVPQAWHPSPLDIQAPDYITSTPLYLHVSSYYAHS